MLGSVANHAWAEDALYVRHSRGSLAVEFESKSAPEGKFNIVNLRNRNWEPRISKLELVEEDEIGKGNGSTKRPRNRQESGEDGPRSNGKAHAGRRPSRIPQFLKQHGPATITDIAEGLSISKQSANQQLLRLEERGYAIKNGTKWVSIK